MYISIHIYIHIDVLNDGQFCPKLYKLIQFHFITFQAGEMKRAAAEAESKSKAKAFTTNSNSMRLYIQT